jgi:2-polyprenyl-6-methoxyphenol hydroxylase-like FAD-dependent oxidoreductase
MDDRWHLTRKDREAVRIVIAGGSAAGLLSALLLSRRGHDVVVLDRDALGPASDVEAAAESAFRAAAPQIVQPHALLPRCRQLFIDHLPDVYEELLSAGAAEVPLAQQMPSSLTRRQAKPGDELFTMIMTRRSTLDWVLRCVAARQPRVELRDRVRVSGLLASPGDPPRVAGVRTDAGDLVADLVLDASGRRSPIDRWLADAGATPTHSEWAECGLSYYSRHYRLQSSDGLPGPPTSRVVAPLDDCLVGLWGADNSTMLMVVAPLTEDRRFTRIRHPAVFEAVLRTLPVFAAWRDVLTPISSVYPMGGLHNTLRRMVIDGRPVAIGVHAVGDAVCTTNPTFGRGVALTLLQAVELSAVLAEHADATAQAIAYDCAIVDQIAPFYRDQASNDAERLAVVRHAVFGAPLAPSPNDPARITFPDLRAAGALDPTLFRAFWKVWGMTERPEQIYRDPEVVQRVRAVLSASSTPPQMPHPSRERLMAALAG